MLSLNILILILGDLRAAGDFQANVPLSQSRGDGLLSHPLSPGWSRHQADINLLITIPPTGLSFCSRSFPALR